MTRPITLPTGPRGHTTVTRNGDIIVKSKSSDVLVDQSDSPIIREEPSMLGSARLLGDHVRSLH